MGKSIRLLSLSFSVVLIVAASTASGQVNPGTDQTQEKFVRILSVRGNRITFAEAASGRGGGRRGANANQNAEQSSGRSGRRRRGRMQGEQSNSNSGTVTLSVDADVRVTLAMQERRTNEFMVGADVNGRFRNDLFRRIPDGGISARLVAEGNRLVAINVIQANDTSLEDIAVKPKRPPRKR